MEDRRTWTMDDIRREFQRYCDLVNASDPELDELAREDSEIAEYIASLEQREDQTSLPEASGEAIAKAFERYLRRRDSGPGG